jgi:hypothetical protein
MPVLDLLGPAVQEQDRQPEQESFRGRLLGSCIHHWEKAIILAILITLIVLVCIKVRQDAFPFLIDTSVSCIRSAFPRSLNPKDHVRRDSAYLGSC